MTVVFLDACVLVPITLTNVLLTPDLSQLRLGWCLWIVLVLVRAFWVCRVGH